jgi:hypothetical protein
VSRPGAFYGPPSDVKASRFLKHGLLHDRLTSLAHETPRLREIPEGKPFMIWAMIKGQRAKATRVGINSALVLGNARAHNPISYRRGALGNAEAASFRTATDRANASGQRALTRGTPSLFRSGKREWKPCRRPLGSRNKLSESVIQDNRTSRRRCPPTRLFQDLRAKRDSKLTYLTAWIASFVRVPCR